MPVLERKHMSRFLHEEVQQSRLLTDQEISATRVLQVPRNTVQCHDIPEIDVPAVAPVNAEWLFQHGHLDKILAIRKQMLHKDFQPTIAKVCKKKESKYVERAGTTYQFGMTFQPRYGPSSCQLGTLSRQEEQSHVRDPFLGLIDVVSDVIKDFLRELKGNGRRQNQLANASLLPGNENNGNATSMQGNFSELAKGLTGIKEVWCPSPGWKRLLDHVNLNGYLFEHS
jgi:hypothetical protein